MIEYQAILHCEQDECLNGDVGPIESVEKMKESARKRGWIINSLQCRCAKHLVGKETRTSCTGRRRMKGRRSDD